MDNLVAIQVSFDLYESATQHFLRRVQEVIQGSLPAVKEVGVVTPVQESSSRSSGQGLNLHMHTHNTHTHSHILKCNVVFFLLVIFSNERTS